MKTSGIYFLAIIITSIGCKPMNLSIGVREVYQYSTTSSFKKKIVPDLNTLLSEPEQIFFISATTDTILYGNQGTVISIQPSCLRTKNSTAYEGKITIHLKELYTKQALLKERAVTISNGSMLESDGSLYIGAQTETGEPLFIECENGIEIRLPRDVQNNMTYFTGARDASGNMNWELNDSIKPILEETYFIEAFDNFEKNTYYMEASPIQTYFFSTKSFGWINCDRFYDDPRDKIDLLATFVLPDYEKNITETYNYIVFDSLMTLLPIYLDDSGQWICPSLPVGETITCISIQKSAQHLYCGIQKTEVGRLGLLVPLKEVNEQELKILLDLTL